MKRRNFILTSLLFASGNCLASAQNSSDQAPLLLDAASQEAMRLLKNPSSAAELGRQYLALNPSLANALDLKRAIGLDGADNYASVKRRFDWQQANDFEQGNIQCIDGWVLSNAEVSLCALAAMATSHS